MTTSYREEDGDEILRVLYENPGLPIALDTETTGLNVKDRQHYCIGISIAFIHNETPYKHYWATRHAVGQNVSRETARKIRYVLQDQERPLIFANRQFDVLSLETLNIQTDHQPFWDIPTMANMLDENTPIEKSLDNIALHYLGEKGKVKDRLIEQEKKSGWPRTTPEMMWDYAVTDAVLTYRVWLQLMKHPNWLELPERLWEEKQELIRVLTAFSRRGVLIDQELVAEQIKLGEAAMEKAVEALGANPASGKDLKRLLIDEMGLPVVKSSAKTGAPSFDKAAMAEYEQMLERDDRPEAKYIRVFRGWQKAVSASYRPYLERVSPDGRLRAEYTTHVTATGRLSCRNPNLQQIPKTSDKPWNGRVKECFVAKPGYVLINADYSQLELRLATAYADEAGLKEVFLEGRDIFTEMSNNLGMSRQDTKTLVYSMQYGAGIKRIMGAFGVSSKEANRIRNNYFVSYPRFKAFSDLCTNRATTTGKVKLWTGRFRRFLYPSDSYKAMNSVIQGGAADIVERAMVRLFHEIDNEDCIMLGQVHDSVLFEIKEELVDDYIPRIKEIMEDVDTLTEGFDGSFGVKFAVEVGPWVE